MREPKWYVLHVISGKEKVVWGKLQKSGITTLLPGRRLRERRGGEFREVERLLFPGYIFIKMKTDDFLIYPTLKKIEGVIRIIGDSSGPLPITEDEALYILTIAEGGKPLEISQAHMAGKAVTVISGPLKGMEGNIIQVDARRHRAKVEMKLLGQKRIIELGIDILN